MRKIAVTLALAFALGGTAFAQGEVPNEAEQHGTASPAAHEGSHAVGETEHEGEEATPGIVNWWSWDYGAAAKDPTHKDWPPPFGFALINFVIFLGLLSRILWKPMKAGMVERHEKIKHDLDEASRLRKAAEAQLAEYTQKVAHVDQEVETLLGQLRKDADNDRVKILAAAETEAKRLRTEADRQIQLEIENARAALRAEVVEAALKAAGELIKARITNDDQTKLAEKYLANLDKARSTTGGAA